ncbi:Wzz/FepE/Etk N-terminal domain-containing protein [Porticoccaceae bacterium]|nr:Wzz/FepE/Etk N-terminal domain-containing protein [Porticoccaceae bacterium]
MQNEIKTPQPYDDEIDLRELFSVLWAGKKLIVAITAVFAVVSVLYALSLANEYKASAVVSPATSGGSSLGSMAGQLGGLASLAGINIGSGESNETQEAMEIMQSWGFMEAFIQTHDLQVPVYAAVGWDKGSNSLKLDDDLYDASSKRWLIEDATSGESRSPSSWELYQRFKSRVAVSQDKKSGLINVSVEYYSPQVAKQWVDLFISTINEYMRARKLEQVNRNIEYLTIQIEKTAIAEMREVFYQLIEEQTKSKMLAEASPEYAFVTVSRAMVPEEKSKPKRALVCILGTLLGGMLSVLWVLVRRYAFASVD